MVRLFRYLKPYRIPIFFVCVFVFLQSLANLYLPNLMADIVNDGILKNNTNYIMQVGGLMLVVSFGGVICSIIASFLSARIAVGFGSLIRKKLFTHVESFSLHEFDSVSTASLITRTTNDTNQVQQVLIIMLSMMVSAPMLAIGGIILAIGQDAQLAWVLVVAIPLLLIVIVLIMSKGIPLFRILQKKVDRLNLVLDEGLTGIRVIRAFDRTKHEKMRFDEANLDLTSTATRVNRIVAVLMPVMMLVLNLTTIAILWFGSIRISNNELQIGAMMAFLQYAMQILFAMLMLSAMFIMIPRASASAVRIREILDMKTDIKDADELKKANEEQGYVEFRNVTFSYPGAEEPALNNISFQARPGQVTAIIGGTGSGKSSLVNLMPRFYDVDSSGGGSILVDGVDIREIAQEDLRSKIGFVPQKAILFTGTIAENIRYGKDEATEDEIWHAANIAQATEFISEMKEGLDSNIAQGGANVSGGQKQRLSIARALIRRPEIYVFDDSFSALDFKTDARLRAALKKETLDATVFIVAQRVSTVMDADQIIVLEDGRIAGIGNHRDLMESSNVYREIVSSQLSMEEIA